MAGMTLDEFLGHTTRTGGGKSNRLGNWKKNRPPQIDIWLHTRAPLTALWQHRWPRIVERKDEDGNQTVQVWGGTWNSWDDEETLRMQYRRDDTGARMLPPRLDPMARMIEQVRTLVNAGELKWTAPVFKFVGDDPSKAQVLHAAGLYGGFGGNLDDDQKSELKTAGISPRHAWMENCMARCMYLFVVVNNDAPEDGVQVTVETTLLGDKVKELILDTMTARGEEEGNPLLHPYCVRWIHVPDTPIFSDRYKAIRMDKIALSDEVKELIEEDPPDTSGYTKRGNVDELRASMETHYCGPKGLLDFDSIFGPAEAEVGMKPEQVERTDAHPPEVKAKPALRAEPKVDVAEEEEEELVECDACGAAMPASADTCPNCGAYYGEEVPPEPEPKKLKKKSATTKASERAKTSNRDRMKF